jgi:hypothetical protein
MNLIFEGISYDFFSAVISVFARMGLKINRYWTIHKDIDQQHLAMGIDYTSASTARVGLPLG